MKTITKPLTHLAKIKEQDKNQQKQIMDLLGWNELTWCQNQYEQGLEFLNSEVDGDERELNLLSKSRAFWCYWKNEWAKRDFTFLGWVNNVDVHESKSAQYHFIHSYDGIRATKRLELHKIEMETIWKMAWKEAKCETASC